MENNAAVLYGPKDLRIEKWLMPEISENEVLIKIECVGICGSDVKLYYTGKCGLEVLSKPIVVGHEGAGVVVEVGSKVTNVAVGDRVAVEPTQPCRSCELCKQGRYNLCTKPCYCSTTDAMGNLCNYYKHVADFCHKIPDNVTMEEAAAVQPLAIAIHACGRANIRLGSILVILGAGPIGVLCAMTAKAMGASKILMTDVVESRLHMAKQQGADYTLLVTPDSKLEDIVDKITKILGTSPNVTIDACGSESAQSVAMMVTRSGGTVLVVGIGEPLSRVPITNALLREVDIRGAYRLLNSYPLALAAVSSGSINLKSFITHHFPLQKSKDAVEFAATGEAMKIIIHL
ncbi:unnamed protein product, partial [Brenthis ino]